MDVCSIVCSRLGQTELKTASSGRTVQTLSEVDKLSEQASLDQLINNHPLCPLIHLQAIYKQVTDTRTHQPDLMKQQTCHPDGSHTFAHIVTSLT